LDLEVLSMTRILVTGGNGGLGRALVARLQKSGHTVRVMSRSPQPAGANMTFAPGRAGTMEDRPAGAPPGVEWAQADLEAGSGLGPAVSDVAVIVHAATSPLRRAWQVDVAGTRRLLEAARAASVAHVVHVSIVGIDRIPFAYYQAKVAGEAVVREAGIPYTILRATQFHSLIDGMLKPLRGWPIALTFTDFKFQPIDTGEVADRLCETVTRPPSGLLPDMGGPEVLSLGEMARIWFAAQGKRARLIGLPLPGAVGHAFRNGYNTCPDHRDGTVTWAEWVQRKYASRPAGVAGRSATKTG
jgi:uncharacterized protein YbjT (DUF2867 family)